MLRQSLPDELGYRFTVADALAAGTTLKRLRARDLQRTFHGTRRRTGASADAFIRFDRLGRERIAAEVSHLERACDYALRMGAQEFFSHVTAAVIWGLPVPVALLLRSIHVAVMAPHRLPRSEGVRGHEAHPARTVLRRDPRTGLLLTDPATTWAMLGGMLADPYDLIAVGDAVIRDWRAEVLGTAADLHASIAAGRRVGINRLREALPYVRSRSASRTETRTRCLLVDAGLAEPELNYDVYDDGGIRIACVDLAYPHLRVAIEYEGEHHLRDPEQWARDIRRYERLAAAGWLVIRVTKAELFDAPHLLVARVRAAVATRA